RGIVERGGGKDEGQSLRVQGRAPFLEALARLRLQPCRVEAQLRVEPVIARDERALGILLLFGLLDVREERRERGLELGLRIGLAVRGQVEAARVRETVHAGGDKVGDVVHQAMPLAALGEVQLPRTGDELVQVGVRGEGGRPHEESDQRQAESLQGGHRKKNTQWQATGCFLETGCWTRSKPRTATARCPSAEPASGPRRCRW